VAERPPTAALVLNAYGATVAGQMELHRVRGGDVDRRELSRRVGVALRDADGFRYAARPFSHRDAEVSWVEAKPLDDLRLFALRETLLLACEGRGLDAWPQKGEINCAGLLPARQAGAFTAQPVLRLRLSVEDYVNADLVVSAQARLHWRTTATLADAGVARWARGERAVRVAGDGPRRAEVVAATSAELLLRRGEDELRANPHHYALAVNTGLAARMAGRASVQEMQLTSGQLTRAGRKNLHAVKHRFGRVAELLDRLGRQFTLPGGEGVMRIDPTPIGIEVER
jgi:hypothetical protein